jgi:hypothetical protein
MRFTEGDAAATYHASFVRPGEGIEKIPGELFSSHLKGGGYIMKANYLILSCFFSKLNQRAL